MSYFAGENTRVANLWSTAYRRLLLGRQPDANRVIRRRPVRIESKRDFRPATLSGRRNVIPVDFGGSSVVVSNRILREAIRSTEDLRSALFWIGISAAAVLALGFLGA